MRRRGGRHQGHVAENLGIVIAGYPGDDDLRFRQQQGMDAIDIRLQRDDLFARGDFRLRCLAARADQQTGGHHCKQRNAERHREPGNVEMIQSGEVGDGGIERGEQGGARGGCCEESCSVDGEESS